MKRETFVILVMILVTGFLLRGCSSSTNSLESILFDQTGTLLWGASPAADGVGILFETEDETYGARGTREDYTGYFPENENQVRIRADIKLTGNTTVRGWGSEFPEIKFIEIKKLSKKITTRWF